MTDEQKAYLVMGFALGMATVDKCDGYFKDLSVEEVARLYLTDLPEGNKDGREKVHRTARNP